MEEMDLYKRFEFRAMEAGGKRFDEGSMKR
jgi:hypothetical protein